MKIKIVKLMSIFIVITNVSHLFLTHRLATHYEQDDFCILLYFKILCFPFFNLPVYSGFQALFQPTLIFPVFAGSSP